MEEAKGRLAADASRFLDAVQMPRDDLLQVDVVTNAGELWAFPFEACFAQHPDWLVDRHRGVILTRRIRGEFSDTRTAWPTVPKVLFVHAPITNDLERSLVEAHITALVEALKPWAKGKQILNTDLLHVREVTSTSHLTRYRSELRPWYIHILAHGAPTPPDPLLPERQTWGLRFGYEGEPGTAPKDIAAALTPEAGAPFVVTLAACDSANQASPAFAVYSVVQELHRCGVPVVVGSQLPLTKHGSRVLTKAFYDSLLSADDVRVALHAVRVALHQDPQSGHDWLSLVGYVRLPPEGYGDHLEEFGLRRELRLLDAAQARADQLNAAGGELGEFEEVERRLLSRLDSLQARRNRLGGRRDLIEECCGLEASAYKRLAELRFLRGTRHPERQVIDWLASRADLEKALAAYRAAYEADLRSHWLGAQQLSLETVLNGRVSQPDDWLLVTRAATIARDTRSVSGQEDIWSCGTLTELGLIAPYAGRSRELDQAKQAAALLVARSRAAAQEFPILSTRRQIERYVKWWTKEHEFFAERNDLSADARELLTVLA